MSKESKILYVLREGAITTWVVFVFQPFAVYYKTKRIVLVRTFRSTGI
jgi:hypothetical protein